MKQMILDGYNVIHELTILKKNLTLSLEDARTALVNFMQIWVNKHAYKGKIKIIFDGNDEFARDNQSSSSNKQASLYNSQSSFSNKQSYHSNSQASFSIGQATCGISCFYSKSGQKADDYIISMVREIKNRSCITIVSNDNYIRGACSSLGATIERPSFLADFPKLKAHKTTSQKSTKKISSAQEKEINEYLKEKWGIE